MADFSPMMQQYLETKKKYPGCILFYRLGDFYEMFFDDAKLASRELELTLTGRECGQPERAPMCGVPYHAAETYIARLIAKGYKVAICEQMEDPATAKGLVKREIIRVVTPGTVLESSMLDEGRNNYLASVCWGDASCCVCFADVSTGEVYVTTIRPAAAQLHPENLERGAGRHTHQHAAEQRLERALRAARRGIGKGVNPEGPGVAVVQIVDGQRLRRERQNPVCQRRPARRVVGVRAQEHLLAVDVEIVVAVVDRVRVGAGLHGVGI